ncbi:GL22141 [Drosophila persimilis]|uniref:Transmembrane protein 141 n=2 Tax=pseudoobscura subgroup TaxID=32358 RepID=A0A6I8V3F2_DROPS|nr:transmembrane protein 141 [Drosophila persimilis]XP_002137739.1 transmembrane protein 141 [Drosophila pseudoobscura]XP_017143166.1 transmembrane protein 141 [Drosophila miranda]EDW34236.1 GL22141 [Drosophila persimilis]
MNDIKQLKDQQRDKHPGFDAYLDCMTRSLFTGLATFCLGFSGTYFAQKIIQSKIRYPAKYNILVASLVATGISYQTTSSRTRSCQAAWMAFEDKHTILKEETF